MEKVVSYQDRDTDEMEAVQPSRKRPPVTTVMIVLWFLFCFVLFIEAGPSVIGFLLIGMLFCLPWVLLEQGRKPHIQKRGWRW
jgi:hypothetical protein